MWVLCGGSIRSQEYFDHISLPAQNLDHIFDVVREGMKDASERSDIIQCSDNGSPVVRAGLLPAHDLLVIITK